MNNRRVTLKNPFRELAHYQNRIWVAFIFVVLLMLVLVARVADLQVNQYEKYRTDSDKNRIRVLPVAPTRGLIFDRNGLIVAENRSIYSLELIPEKIRSIEKVVEELQQLLDIDSADIDRFWNEYKSTRSRFRGIPLAQKLNQQQVAKFSVNRHRFDGVNIEARLVRYYPYAEQLVHALGYVGRINDRELQSIDQDNYRATRHIGKVGLEKYYESQLHGVIGSREVETDVQGRVLRVMSEVPPKAGKDLHLTMDLPLQLRVSEIMRGKRGAVIALDPANGAVLAMVSNPAYNPNLFVTGISTKDYKKISESPDRPQFNRAIRGQYSPGSTIKPHLAWLGLEKQVVYPNYSIRDTGLYTLPGEEERTFRDWLKNGHGEKVNYRLAIARSCDIYFYDLAYRLGIDTIFDAMSDFGFGQLTNIDMGEEVPGLMPSRDWKRGARGVRWFPGETVIIGIGQGYWTATPLQLANAASVIASSGARFDLRMVEAIGSGDEQTSNLPQLSARQINVGNGENLKRIQQAMYDVNHSYALLGSARDAFANTPYKSAGKTGTVQLFQQTEEYEAENFAERLRDNALYIGYAPFDDPQIAVAVVVENAGGGGSNAAPIARQILDYYLVEKDKTAAPEELPERPNADQITELFPRQKQVGGY